MQAGGRGGALPLAGDEGARTNDLTLWRFGEDPSLGRFVPRHGKVWAIDERHSRLYWFPRDRPRACFWAVDTTREDDVERWLDDDPARRVAVIECVGLERIRAATLYAYRLPREGIELRIAPALYPPWDRVVESTLDYSGIRLRNAVRS